MSVEISYGAAATAFERFSEVVHGLCVDPAVSSVCEVGAGANPLLAQKLLHEQRLDCLLLDRSPAELAKAPDGYRRLCGDIVVGDFDRSPCFDLLLSRTVAEHVSDPVTFHRHAAEMLRAGGIAAHFFPTLYWPPFVLNRLLPEALSARLLRVLQPGREPEGRHGKFPARYRWCRGPLRGQIARLERTGFDVLEYGGFFGQPDYVARIAPLARLDRALTARLLKRPIPWLTSYAYVVLRRR